MVPCTMCIAFVIVLCVNSRYRVPSNRLPILRQRPYVLDILLLVVSLSFGIWWIVERHSRSAHLIFIFILVSSIQFLNLRFHRHSAYFDCTFVIGFIVNPNNFENLV